MNLAPPVYDVTARKAHQFGMLVLVASGFLLGDAWGWLYLKVGHVLERMLRRDGAESLL